MPITSICVICVPFLFKAQNRLESAKSRLVTRIPEDPKTTLNQPTNQPTQWRKSGPVLKPSPPQPPSPNPSASSGQALGRGGRRVRKVSNVE